MMRQIQTKAWAKLNLSLDVTERRPNGYHSLCMVMQSTNLYDNLTITLTEDGSFSAMTNRRYLPRDDRNIAVRAAKNFVEAAGLHCGVRVDIRKRIPVCAGLGGGSADAAAVLRALNKLTGAGFSADKLREIGLTLGADVPYCIEGGTVLATGLGDILEPLPPLPDCHILICKPPFPISTPVLFKRLDESMPLQRHPNTSGLVEALHAHDLPRIARRMYNVFEDALTGPARNKIEALRTGLLNSGALGAMMTGTGSAVFGLFANRKGAANAQACVAEMCEESFLAKPIGQYE